MGVAQSGADLEIPLGIAFPRIPAALALLQRPGSEATAPSRALRMIRARFAWSLQSRC